MGCVVNGCTRTDTTVRDVWLGWGMRAHLPMCREHGNYYPPDGTESERTAWYESRHGDHV